VVIDVTRNMVYNTYMIDIKKDIKKYRLRLDLTQNAFAKLLKVKNTSISSYESGLYNPSYKTLLKLKKLIKDKFNEDLEI